MRTRANGWSVLTNPLSYSGPTAWAILCGPQRSSSLIVGPISTQKGFRQCFVQQSANSTNNWRVDAQENTKENNIYTSTNLMVADAVLSCQRLVNADTCLR